MQRRHPVEMYIELFHLEFSKHHGVSLYNSDRKKGSRTRTRPMAEKGPIENGNASKFWVVR